MKTKAQIGIGDAVEVRMMVRPALREPIRGYGLDDPPPDPSTISINWVPGTVCHSSRNEIGVAFADGERLSLTRYSRDWRAA